MKGFKKVCLFGMLCIISSSATNSYVTDTVESDIVRRYQQEVLNNARYNNYKDSRKKYLKCEIEDLNSRINDYNDRIKDCSYRISNLNYELDFRKNKRTQLDGKLAELMCLDDLGDSTAQSRMSMLQKDISLNEDEIRNYEYQKNSYVSEKNGLISKKDDLECKLRNIQRELNRL